VTLTERFNPNNVELNKRRFNELHGHILNAKTKNKNKSKGAKFTNAELILELSASDEDTAKKS